MNKIELVTTLANRIGATKKDAENVLAAFQDIVKEELSAGHKVHMVGFGTFETVERAARMGRNPKTGEEMQLAASKTPKFKPGKTFKEALKSE